MFTQKAFSFSADCKALEQSIKKVSTVVGGQQAAYFIGVAKGALYVLALSADSFVMLTVPNSETSSKEGIFGFDISVLPGLIKNRSVMEFKYAGTDCQFTQVKGKYSGKINTIGVTDDQLSQIATKASEKASGTVKLTSEQLAAIKQGLQATGVKDVYQNTTLLSYVVLKAGKLQVSSFDAQHFGYFNCKCEGADFRAALPQTHFSVIDQLAAGGDMQISITNNGLRARGKTFLVTLPATQSEDRHFTLVSDFIKSLSKPVYEAEVDVESLTAVADNLFTLYNANANFSIKAKGDIFTLGLSAASGSASDSIKVKGAGKEIKLSVDPRLLMDILSLAKSCTGVKASITDKVIYLKGTLGDKGPSVFLACSRVE